MLRKGMNWKCLSLSSLKLKVFYGNLPSYVMVCQAWEKINDFSGRCWIDAHCTLLSLNISIFHFFMGIISSCVCRNIYYFIRIIRIVGLSWQSFWNQEQYATGSVFACRTTWTCIGASILVRCVMVHQYISMACKYTVLVLRFLNL